MSRRTRWCRALPVRGPVAPGGLAVSVRREMMNWTKMGIVSQSDGSLSWGTSHAMIPTPLTLSNGHMRVFVTCCDDNGIGRCGYVDVDAADTPRVGSFSTGT